MITFNTLFLAVIISFVLSAQDYNKIVTDDETGEPMLLGYTTREAFSDTSFASWFTPEYTSYKPDSLVLAELKNGMNDISVTLVMGTWCDDSRMQVPGFFKILDKIDYPGEKVTIISVSRDKKVELKNSDGDIYDYEVSLVPSFVLYRNNEEIGRIEEMPKETLEKDMLKIVGEDRYIPNDSK